MVTEIICISLTSEERDWLMSWLDFSAHLNIEECEKYAAAVKQKFEHSFLVKSTYTKEEPA